MRHLCTWLALLVGLGVALSVPTSAAEKADDETISKLISKLSSNRFAEREKAQKGLEEIGLPALDALKKAAEEATDMETRRRAGELAAKLEKQAAGAKVLAAKKIKLSFKDTPLKEAVEELKKKSGYDLVLLDPENKLKDRKVTLDTGETTFWQAFDRFCAKAGLVEAGPEDFNQGFPVPQPQPPIFLPGGPGGAPGALPVKPVPGIRILPAPEQPPVKRAPVEKKQPVEKDVRLEKQAKEQAVAAAVQLKAVAAAAKAEEPAKAPAQAGGGKARAGKAQAAPAVVQPLPAIAPAVQPVPPPAILPVPPGGRRPIRPQPWVQPGQPGQIVLKDGKAKDIPTAYSGAVRVQAMDNAAQMFGVAPEGEVLLGLRVSPEPKIRWQGLVAVRVDKAVDDQEQTLTPAMEGGGGRPGVGGPFPGGGFGGVRIRGGVARPAWGGGFGFGTLHNYIPVRLKKAEKAPKSLKELSGSISALVLAEAEVHINADKILDAKGKTFKGKEGGSIKVNNVTENGGRITLQVELDQPANVVPAQMPVNHGIEMPIDVLPVPLPPQVLPAPGGAFQVQVQGAAPAVQVQVAPAKVQAAAQVQVIQIQVGGGPAVQGVPAFFGGNNGMELQDEKGNVIPCVGAGMAGRAGGPGGGFVAEHHLTFQVQKGQKPARLVFKGSKQVTVDIPFSLKNVPTP